MANKLLLVSCAALTLLMISAVSTPADARRGGHSFGGGGHHFAGHARFHAGGHFRPNAHFAHRRFHRHRHIFIGAPLLYGGYYYGYGDCYWLRRRALHTGSQYWWNRYHACLYGYGY